MWQINDQLKILLPGEFSTVFLQSNPLSALNFFFSPPGTTLSFIFF